MSAGKPIVVIVGPTAGGKTQLAIALALRLPGGGECLCADSMQVYRGMDIGTAKPAPEQRASVTHHLIDIVDPDDDTFSVDRWLTLAEQTIAEVRARDQYPIVVGGTNLYIKALLEGLFDGPGPDRTLRADLETHPLRELRETLERVDPESAMRIHPNDRRRTVRALEVFYQTGIPLSAQQQEWDRGRMRPDALVVGLDYPSEVINRRINERVGWMIRDGLVAEARLLHDSGQLGLTAGEALGYKQLIAHFRGEIPLEKAIEQIKIKTRRYAKQQRTWLRRFRTLENAMWAVLDDPEAQPPVDKILTWITTRPSKVGSTASHASRTAPGSV